MKYFFLPIIALLLLSIDSLAADKNYRAKQYYLRHSIIYLGSHLPKVSPDQIIFTPACICSFSSEVYSGRIINRGAALEIIDIDERGDWSKVKFISQNQTHEMLLKSDSKKNFRKSFDLIFSGSKVSDRGYGAATTKQQLIKYYGFPISICREGEVERWFYILEFSGDAFGYDGCCIVIKNNRIVSVSGYI